jgi:hypothetical protein
MGFIDSARPFVVLPIVFGILASTPAVAQPAATAAQASGLRLVAGGIGGGAAGVLAGGLAAVAARSLVPCDDQDGCIREYGDWAVTGAFIGESLLLPLGTHLANGRQGQLAPALLASAGIGAAGVAAYWSIQKYGTDDWGNTRGNPDALTTLTLVAMPVLQLVSSVLIERATARRRASPTR